MVGDAARGVLSRRYRCVSFLFDGPAGGTGTWRLLERPDQPTESEGLSTPSPERLKKMLAAVDADHQRAGVVLAEPGYDVLRQLLARRIVGLSMARVVIGGVMCGLSSEVLTRIWQNMTRAPVVRPQACKRPQVIFESLLNP